EGCVLLDQFLSGGSAAVLGLDSSQDLVGMIVDALAAAAGLLGLRGDRAVGAQETSGRIGDPTNKRYGAHGGGSSGVWTVGSKIAIMRSIPSNIKRVLAESCQVSS